MTLAAPGGSTSITPLPGILNARILLEAKHWEGLWLWEPGGFHFPGSPFHRSLLPESLHHRHGKCGFSSIPNIPNISKYPQISTNIHKYPQYPKISPNIPKYPQICGHSQNCCLLITPKTQAWIFQALVEGWQTQQREQTAPRVWKRRHCGKGQQLYFKKGEKKEKKRKKSI